MERALTRSMPEFPIEPTINAISAVLGLVLGGIIGNNLVVPAIQLGLSYYKVENYDLMMVSSVIAAISTISVITFSDFSGRMFIERIVANTPKTVGEYRNNAKLIEKGTDVFRKVKYLSLLGSILWNLA